MVRRGCFPGVLRRTEGETERKREIGQKRRGETERKRDRERQREREKERDKENL